MAAPFVDQRAPGVSRALRTRIGTLLDSGATVSLRRNNLVLRDVVLTRANGTETPAAAELRLQVARRGLDPANFSLERWDRGTGVEQVGNSTFAFDRAGNRHMIARRRNGQRVATAAGRRFYQDAPLTQWIVNVPVISVRARTGGRFNPRYIPITADFVEAMTARASGGDFNPPPDLRWTRDGPDAQEQIQRMLRAWQEWFRAEWPDTVPPEYMDSPSADTEGVKTVVDQDRPWTYDVQQTGVTGSGALSVDTMLDQVVFGAPVTSHDLWMKCHLHENSRRRNGECGLDVIVASASWRHQHADKSRTTKALFTADQAAAELVALAKEHFPDSALAQACNFDEPQDDACAAAVEVDTALRSRGLVKTPAATDLQKLLEPYLPKMLDHLQTPRTFDEIAEAHRKGNIYRQTPKQKKTEPPLPAESLFKALARHISWSMDPQQRLLTFLRLFKFKIMLKHGRFVAKDTKKRVELPPEAPTEETTAAREALQKHGTPMRLLEMFYKKLKVRLVIFQGATCRYVHTPDDWDTRGKDEKQTVVLNVWSKHVFTYTRGVHNRQFEAHAIKVLPDKALVTLRDEERYKFEDMLPLDWALLLEKHQEGDRGAVFWTTSHMDEGFFKPLEDMGLAFTPYWPTTEACTSVFIPIGDKSKAGIRIKRVPANHCALEAFCATVEQRLQVKLTYCGESAGLLCHKLLQQLLVRRRETISDEEAQQLLAQQKNRCAQCGDLLKKFEKHHKVARAEGGSNLPDNIALLCPPCHAQETEKQEQAGRKSSVWLESRLSPQMMELFRTTPKPRQLVWGDQKAQAMLRRADDFEKVKCLDVCGCRSNVIMERTRPLPIGCPLDDIEPVFDEDGKYLRPLTDFEWLWVDVYEQREADSGFQDVPDLHKCYDGPHMYPLATVLYLIDDGFLKPCANTIPFGWVPTHSRPASDLIDAFRKVEEVWQRVPYESIVGEEEADEIPDACQVAEERSKQAKLMRLAAIGLWNAQSRVKLTAYRTDNEADVPGPVRMKKFTDKGTLCFHDTEVHDNRTMLPLALQTLFAEQVHMHRAMKLIEKVPRLVPLAARVDGIYFAGSAEATTELKALAFDCKYALSQRSVYQLKDARIDNLPQNNQQYEYNANVYLPFIGDAEWRHYHERDTHRMDDIAQHMGVYSEADGFEWADKVARVIVAAEGGLVTGPPGSGKSHLIKKLQALLTSQGKKHVTCAYTHAAARLVGGSTVARLLHFDKRLHDAWVIIDEVSLLPIDTLGQIARWQYIGVKFAIFGDFEGQFEAFKDRWTQVCYSAVPDSELLRGLCKGMHFHMEVYRRGTDQALFDWYSSMYAESDANVARLVCETRRRYPVRVTPMEAQTVLCISHANRMIINERQNTAFAALHEAAGKHTEHVEWSGEDLKGTTCQPQSMTIWEGIHLIACPRGSGKAVGVVQGVVYSVESISEETVSLKMLPEYCNGTAIPLELDAEVDEFEGRHGQMGTPEGLAFPHEPDLVDVSKAKEEVTVPLADVPAVLRMTHAMCYYTVQGRTLRGHTLLLDTGHPHFSRRALIVGLSRATHGDHVHVACDDDARIFLGERRRTVKRVLTA